MSEGVELRATVLVVEPSEGRALAAKVSLERARVVETGADAAMSAIENGAIDAVVLRLESPEALGLVATMAARWPDLPIVAVVVAGGPTTDEAVAAGALDAIAEDATPDVLGHALRRGILLGGASGPHDTESKTEILGRSKPIRRLRELIELAAPGTATILIRGESGTGKELVARAVHAASERRSGPFVKVHGAALPDTLLESELFGYEPGAFTGAVARKPGRVDLAQGGTLFLDEIGDITPAIQVKLLRLLQDRTFERLGASESIAADVRFVAATHRDLETMVKQGSFREDLFYRLNVVPLWVPPLRARGGDVRELAARFCDTFATRHGRERKIDDDALGLLEEASWPGNVRQLQNLVERLVILTVGQRIGRADVERELAAVSPFSTGSNLQRPPTTTVSEVIPLEAEVRKAERRALARALRHADNNRSLAARLLGIARATLYKKLAEYGMS